MKVLDIEMIDSIRELQTAEDPDILAAIVTTFLESFTDRIEEIKITIQSGDPDALESQTHSLKSSAAILGGVHMTYLCAELEKTGRSGKLDGALKQFSSLRAAATEFKRELEKLPELKFKPRESSAA